MGKTQKSAIYDCFQSVNAEVDTTNATYIIDGGYLLHHVVWDRVETVFEKYVQYHYGHKVMIVFDGYSDSTKNIKAAEQRRRTTKTSSCSGIIFETQEGGGVPYVNINVRFFNFSLNLVILLVASR